MDPARLRSPDLARSLARRIAAEADREMALMEVCGTHTMAIGRHGIRSLLPPSVRLLSGPGCPVCVTAAEDIDRVVLMARDHDVVVTTFGDMFRVPGSLGSLEDARAAGARVEIVYSPLEAVARARRAPGEEVVFVGVGFETTTPTVAAAARTAREEGLANFSILPLAKTVPPALAAILEAGEARVDGFLLPGHVCAILGTEPLAFVARVHRRPAVVTGFEPVDILQGIAMLAAQLRQGRAAVEIQYTRVVKAAGNPVARALVEEVFLPADAPWRAIGTIPASGLAFREEYRSLDARERFPVAVPPPREDPGCRCGEILMGLVQPRECPLFGTRCTPLTPVGPCMVSSEGVCAAHYKYGDHG
jgi:hydrogenase expression/formation protein HypD